MEGVGTREGLEGRARGSSGGCSGLNSSGNKVWGQGGSWAWASSPEVSVTECETLLVHSHNRDLFSERPVCGAVLVTVHVAVSTVDPHPGCCGLHIPVGLDRFTWPLQASLSRRHSVGTTQRWFLASLWHTRSGEHHVVQHLNAKRIHDGCGGSCRRPRACRWTLAQALGSVLGKMQHNA